MPVKPRRSTLAEVSLCETSLTSSTRPKKLYGVKKIKIIAIVGPTASGKSGLAVSLAQKLNGEIISADSRQVYIGMDIGTGKITKREMKRIPHYLLDVSSPKKEFNVSDFKELAKQKIKEIASRGKLPIIVGGTGFWIDSLVYDWKIPEVKPDKKLRAKLEKLSTEKLFIKLKKLDPERAKNIDAKNRRRLVRALEIVISTGEKIPETKLSYDISPYEALILGINPPKEILEKKIKQRLIQRLKSGMIREIKNLHENGVSWKRLDDFGLEYRYISRYLRGWIGYKQMSEELYKEICRYAKRQMTWFRRNKSIKWFVDSSMPLRYSADKTLWRSLKR